MDAFVLHPARARCLALALFAATGCGPAARADGTTTSDTSDTSGTGGEQPTGPDTSMPTTGAVTPTEDPCEAAGTCGAGLLDILLVIDNSATMAEEQAKLVAGVPKLVASLRSATDRRGDPLDLDVHLMITTSDVGHALCAGTAAPDYVHPFDLGIGPGCARRDRRLRGPPVTDPSGLREPRYHR